MNRIYPKINLARLDILTGTSLQQNHSTKERREYEANQSTG